MGNSIDIQRNEAHSRFEAWVEGHVCVIDYRLNGDLLDLTSVRVPKPVEGRGIAAALTRAALDWARAQPLQVRPICPYVIAWLKRHPDYQDLVQPAHRDAG